MKFGQLMEYNRRNIQNSSRLILVFQKNFQEVSPAQFAYDFSIN